MRIGISAQLIFRNKKHGMDIVALELIKNLQKLDQKNEYIIFAAPGPDEQCLKETSNFKICKFKGIAYPFWEQFFLPLKAKSERCDILHCTTNTAPIFSNIPMILTLHDIIYLVHNKLWQTRGTLYQILGNNYRRFIVPLILKKSKKIVTVSSSEKESIEKYIGKTSKLDYIHNGVSEHFKKISDQKQLLKIKNKYNLPSNFFLFLGNTAPKKNTLNVLRAYSEFKKNTNNDFKLVILDYEENHLNKMLLNARIENIEDDIYIPGYIKNKDLPGILNLSYAFLYPSLYESFGIPILESMACGIPVITSNVSSMPEIAESAAILINPENISEIAEALKKITEDEKLKNKLIEAGEKQVKKFSWRIMSENYLKLYNEIYNTLNT